MDFSSTAKCWDNHVIPRLAGEGEIYRLIRSSRCSPRGSDYAILPIILKRRIYDTRLLSLFCGFISIFISFSSGLLPERFLFWVFSQNDFFFSGFLPEWFPFSQLGFFPSCSFEIDVHVFVVLSWFSVGLLRNAPRTAAHVHFGGV